LTNLKLKYLFTVVRLLKQFEIDVVLIVGVRAEIKIPRLQLCLFDSDPGFWNSESGLNSALFFDVDSQDAVLVESYL